MNKLHIHSEEVIKYAKENNVTLFQAMAILSAKAVKITSSEMNLYMEVFQRYMDMIMPVEEAISMSIHYVIAVSVPDRPIPEQKDLSKFTFSEN